MEPKEGETLAPEKKKTRVPGSKNVREGATEGYERKGFERKQTLAQGIEGQPLRRHTQRLDSTETSSRKTEQSPDRNYLEETLGAGECRRKACCGS